MARSYSWSVRFGSILLLPSVIYSPVLAAAVHNITSFNQAASGPGSVSVARFGMKRKKRNGCARLRRKREGKEEEEEEAESDLRFGCSITVGKGKGEKKRRSNLCGIQKVRPHATCTTQWMKIHSRLLFMCILPVFLKSSFQILLNSWPY